MIDNEMDPVLISLIVHSVYVVFIVVNIHDIRQSCKGSSRGETHLTAGVKTPRLSAGSLSACAIERDLSQFVIPLYFQLFMLQDGRIEWASDAGFVKAIEVGQQCQESDPWVAPTMDEAVE
jgi:hypothetical protein